MTDQGQESQADDSDNGQGSGKLPWVVPTLKVIDVLEQTTKAGATPPSDGGFKQS
ncbi:MAG: hypothetical protein ACPGOY_04780 [Rhodospirillaceae bacterium]